MKTGDRLPVHVKRVLGVQPVTGQSGTDIPVPGKEGMPSLPVTGSPVSVTDKSPASVTGEPLPETGVASKRKLIIKSSDESEQEILAKYGIGPLSSSRSSSRMTPVQKRVLLQSHPLLC